MDEVDWKVLWSAALAPDQAMIPRAHVFHTRQKKRFQARSTGTWIQAMSLLPDTEEQWQLFVTSPHAIKQPDTSTDTVKDYTHTHSNIHTTSETEFLWIQAMSSGETY